MERVRRDSKGEREGRGERVAPTHTARDDHHPGPSGDRTFPYRGPHHDDPQAVETSPTQREEGTRV